MATQKHLDNSHYSSAERIANRGTEMIREAIEAMEAGDRGRPAEDVLEDVCKEAGLYHGANESLGPTTKSP